MSDARRAEITNGIWLCRTCHGLVDRDAILFPSELLFAWRKNHEERVQLELGTRGERIRFEVEKASFHFLQQYPMIIQRIAQDKPIGWEWRLAAELLRHRTAPHVRRLDDLISGNYYTPHPRIRAEDFIGWIHERTHVMSNVVGPLSRLFDGLTRAFGEPGEPGDAAEIHHICALIDHALLQIVNHEEVLRFTVIPEEGEELRSILIDAVGSNLAKLVELPDKLDDLVALASTDHKDTVDKPRVFVWEVTFELPNDFVENFTWALRRYERSVGL